MKSSLTLLVFVSLSLFSYSQNSTKSTFTFNTFSGLNSDNKEQLENLYLSMNDENYHCFNLVSADEKSKYPNSKLTNLAKQRAAIIQKYYYVDQEVAIDNVFIKYGGQFPTLWLHKPDAHLVASGQINLEDKYKQCYNYNPSLDKTIITDNGNRFYFAKYAFETLSGSVVKNSDVDICLWEFADKKSLIYANLTTSANGKMLETAGSFYIEASLNGEKLKLRTGESFTVEMPTTKSFPDMFTYYGNQQEGFVDWTVDKNEPVMVNNPPTIAAAPPIEQEIVAEEDVYFDEYGDNLNNRNGVIDGVYYNDEGDETIYQLASGKLGWINCDRFYEVKETSTFAVKVDSKEPVVVRLVFRDIESVMPCYSNSNHKNKYEASGIPTGEKVLVLAYSVKDDNAILGYKEVTIGENSLEEISLNNLSKTRFESAVRELLY